MHGAVDLVVPVKELRRAKSRLAPAVAGLPGSDADREHAHRALALALACDTLRAARAAVRTARVVVVTGDPAVRFDDEGGIEAVPDAGDGLNAAVRHGAEHLRRTGGARHGVAVLQADLPALRPDELDAALDRAASLFAAGSAAAFVADHAGSGTTLLVTAPGRVLRPRFGPGSAAAHAQAGAVALDGGWPGLRGDVDTVDDLVRARALGTGPRTAAWPGAPPGPATVGGRVAAPCRVGDDPPVTGRCPRGGARVRAAWAASLRGRAASRPRGASGTIDDRE